jgi:hypothetical protein
VANVSVNEGYLSVRDHSNYNDEQVTVGDQSLGEQDNPLDDLLYLSEEFNMKMFWSVENLTCSIAMSRGKIGKYACRSVNSTCVSVTYGHENTKRQLGYRCKCSQGFEGNPYTLDGCKGNHTQFSHTNCHHSHT